jgi:hypothetical protein
LPVSPKAEYVQYDPSYGSQHVITINLVFVSAHDGIQESVEKPSPVMLPLARVEVVCKEENGVLRIDDWIRDLEIEKGFGTTKFGLVAVFCAVNLIYHRERALGDPRVEILEVEV